MTDSIQRQDNLATAQRWWRLKYVLEWMVAFGGVLVILPLLVLIALIVKVTSAGPVLYVSPRLGRNGRVFSLYKFRSMRVNVPQLTAPDGKVITLKNDSRLTPIGTFLRLGFDELPQLFNVLKGDMTLIGPRPDVPSEWGRYTEREGGRLKVLTGITGLTQVVGGREMNNAQNYELDVRYVERAGLGTDLLILLLTLPYSLGGKNMGKRFLKSFLVGIEDLGK